MTNEQDFDGPGGNDSGDVAGEHAGGEAFPPPAADRAPTPDEAAAAERARGNVDVNAVAEEYEHMTELGANVQGEGQIESD